MKVAGGIETYKGGLGDTAMQHAWMRYADENEVPHDHEDEEAFKYGFDAGRSAENAKAILRWKSRCEELEVIAAGLYLGHDEASEQFSMYREVYLADQGKIWQPTEEEPFPY